MLIAYDRDAAGDGAAEKLAGKLIAAGIESLRVQFPKGMDANDYALKVTPAPEEPRRAAAPCRVDGQGRGAAS